MFNFIVLLVVIFGSINWFAIGVFQFDLIAGIFGSQSEFFSRFIYTLVGLAGLWTLSVVFFKRGSIVYFTKKPKLKKQQAGADPATPTSATQGFTSQPTHNALHEVNPINTSGTLVSERTLEKERVYDIPPIRPAKPSRPKIKKQSSPPDQPKI